MRRFIVLSVLAFTAQPVVCQDKVNIGISGWTGFAPLTLALQAGIFRKNGVEATIKKIPQQSRHLAIASGDIQCAATTVETWLVWNANGVLTKQIFQLDKSYGADGMATRNGIASIAHLKGKTIGSQAPGTSPYFVMAWMLKKNGLTPKDVTVVSIDPGPAAQAFLKVMQSHQGSAKVPNSLLKLAMTLEQLGQKDCALFNELETRHPNAAADVKSRARLVRQRVGC